MKEGDIRTDRPSPEQRAELAKLEALLESEIDTMDIPQAPVENWAFGRHGEPAIGGDPSPCHAPRSRER